MARRHYANAAATTLTAPVGSADTTLQVASVTGLPVSYPFTLILDRETPSEEVVLVTAGSGTALTATRGYDNTPAFSHANGAVVVHGISAIDPDEANAHVNASSGVHGVTGSLVGTSETQTLTNKTLDNTNTINGFTANNLLAANSGGRLSSTSIPTSSVVDTTSAQTLTNKTIDPASNTITGLPTPSTIATLDGTQTLTNKTLTAPTISSPNITGATRDLTLSCSTTTTFSTTPVQVSGMSGSVTVASASDVFLVTIALSGVSGSSQQAWAILYVDGAGVYTVPYAYAPNALVPLPINGTWLLSGLSAGSHTISVYIQSNNANGGVGNTLGQSIATVVRIS